MMKYQLDPSVTTLSPTSLLVKMRGLKIMGMRYNASSSSKDTKKLADVLVNKLINQLENDLYRYGNQIENHFYVRSILTNRFR